MQQRATVKMFSAPAILKYIQLFSFTTAFTQAYVKFLKKEECGCVCIIGNNAIFFIF